MKRKDIKYKRFGWLLALSPIHKNKAGNWQWLCCCVKPKCLRLIIVGGNRLRGGHSTQCRRCAMTKHGHAIPQSPTYRSWACMISRCTNKNTEDWKSYGAKGVKVCSRWRLFKNFLADMGLRPSGTTLGRKRDKGNYASMNCSWQTPAEQVRERIK